MKPPAVGRDADAFWTFSLRFYALPSVSQACLALQDDAGADVNILLYLLHLAQVGRAIDVENLARMDAAVAPWREQVVRPLRTVRQALKGNAETSSDQDTQALRDEVKRSELASERIEQRLLVRACPAKDRGDAVVAPLVAVKRNIAAYSAYLGRDFPDSIVSTLLASFESI